MKSMVTIDNHYFSISQICESGQCFRLDPVSENTYELLAGGKYLKIEVRQQGQLEETGRTILHCSKEEYEEVWKEYFDLSASYADYARRIDEADEYLKAAARFGQGIRILRQDVWEMIITFIISQQNNIPRIKGLIRALCEKYGRRKETPEGGFYDTFPDAEALAGVSEEELRELKLGYRSKYICGTARMAVEGDFDLEKLKGMAYEDARAELMRLPGIGGKVADCICCLPCIRWMHFLWIRILKRRWSSITQKDFLLRDIRDVQE